MSVSFEESVLGKMLMEHKLGCLLPFLLTIFGIVGYLVYRNWETIQDIIG